MKMHKSLHVAAAALVLVGNIAAQQPTPQPPSQPQLKTPVWNPEGREHRRLVRDARVKEGLKAAAKLDGGGYVDYVDFDYELDADGIAVLVDSADTIVRGIVMKNRCLLVRGYVGYAEPVETIVTDYTISVFDVYKGNPGLHARDITVRVPGGRVEFGDGLWAETSTGDFLPPLNLQEFILFLSPHESEKGVYVPTNNRLGMFEVEPGGRVTPRARSETLLARSVKRGYAEFVAEVRERIARTKPR